MKTADAVKIFLLGMVTAFLAIIAFRPQSAISFAADSGRAGDLIAVAAATQNQAVLFLIDTASKQIAQYAVDNQRFSLRGARHYGYDLAIEEASQPGGIDLKNAKKLAQESTKAGGK